jgi:hypothetical protein
MPFLEVPQMNNHTEDFNVKQGHDAPRTTSDNLGAERNFSNQDYRSALAQSERCTATTAMEAFPQADLLLKDIFGPKDHGSGETKGTQLGPKDHGSGEVNRNEDGVRRLDKQESPTELADRLEATAALDKHINPMMKSTDQETMQNLHAAIANGDSAQFADAMQRFHKDATGMREFMNMLNRNLENTNSGITVHPHGNRVTIVGLGDRAVEISTDGRASVREVTHNLDGSLQYGAYDHNGSPRLTMRNIGQQARLGILYTP